MITVTLYQDGFTIVGHADYAALGEDIVCAGVSALAQSVSYAMNEYFNGVISHARPGYMYLRVEDYENDEVYGALYLAFDHGVNQMAEQYPYHVKVIKKYKETIPV